MINDDIRFLVGDEVGCISAEADVHVIGTGAVILQNPRTKSISQ
jgi:hypothetical protein